MDCEEVEVEVVEVGVEEVVVMEEGLDMDQGLVMVQGMVVLEVEGMGVVEEVVEGVVPGEAEVVQVTGLDLDMDQDMGLVEV